MTALHLLGSARSVIGSVDSVTGVVNVLGLVRATPEFRGLANVALGL